MRRLHNSGKPIAIIALVGALLALFPLTKPTDYILSFMYLLFAYAAMATAWNVIGGFAGYLSFGHVTFFGIGAYAAGLMLIHWGWSPLWAAPLAGAAAALIAVIAGYPTLRLRGPYFTVVTVVLVLAANIVVLNTSWTGAALGLWLPFPPWDPFTSRIVFYETMLGILVVTVLLVRWIQQSKFGIGLLIIREDEDVAGTVGVNAFRLKLTALAFSAFVAGVVGAVYAYDRAYLHPDFMFDLHPSIMIVLIALLGGRNHWFGPVLGAAAVMIAEELLTVYVGTEVARMLFGLLLIIVIIFLPEGLVSMKLTGRRIDKNRGETPTGTVAS